MIECTITECKNNGIKKYDLFGNKPRFFQMLLCKEHSKEANESLKTRGLKVNKNGTYKTVIDNAKL